MNGDSDRDTPDPEEDPGLDPDEGEQREGDIHAPPDDWDTLRRFDGFKSGDPEARELFCLHYDRHIRRYIRAHPLMPWLERHGWLQDDILGEVYSAFLVDAPLRFFYRGKGSMEGWLKVLTQRTAIDLYRRESSQKRGGGATDVPLGAEIEERVVGRPSGSHADDPVSDASYRELMEVAAVILSEDEFFVWETVDLQGSTDREVSELITRTPSAVRGIVYRARQKLRERLDL